MKFEYYALLLDEKSHDSLLTPAATYPFDRPEDWKVFAHHMTIMHRSRFDLEMANWAESHLGEEFTVKAVSIGMENGVMAVGVKGDVPSTNVKPHVTIAVAPGAKPFMSNNIKEWLAIHRVLELTGKIVRI